MFMTSLKRWKGSTFLLVPVIVGLIFMGAPMNAAWAKPGNGKGGPTSNVEPLQVTSLTALNNEARILAGMAGLNSLRLAIQGDAAAGIGQPLLLNPELGPRNVPLPNNLQNFLNSKNKNARKVVAQLGKALFWEMAIGSDGNACASCHFHAGADNRVKNQLNPDILRIENNRIDDIQGFHFALGTPDFALDPPFTAHNDTFVAGDFPFVTDIGNGDNVVDPVSALAAPEFTDFVNTIGPAAGNTNDVASSQGVFLTEFESVITEYGTARDFALDSNPVKIRDLGIVEPDIAPPPGTNQGAGFQVGGINVRRVEPRNTPPTVNAVFNFHQFWDGRANNRFNGVTPFGDTDREARIFVRGQGKKGGLATRNVNLKEASLASQAVGPPLSRFEMSFFGRIWPDIGKKMVTKPSQFAPVVTPSEPNNPRFLLESQTVATDDTLLGELRTDKGAVQDGKGIAVTYKELIQQAFNPNLWDDTTSAIILPAASVTEAAPNNPIQNLGEPVIMSLAEAQALVTQGVLPEQRVFNQMEANFSFFFGFANMLYEAELVADHSRFDQFMEGLVELTEEEIIGLLVFINADEMFVLGIADPAAFPEVTALIGGLPDGIIKNGKCVNCHGGPEFTNASVRNAQFGNNLIEPMLMGNLLPALYDNGFYNIAVTPTPEDVGRGGKGPEDKPLASSRQFLFAALGIDGPINFPIIGEPICNLVAGPGGPTQLGFVDPVEGFFQVGIDANADGCIDRNEVAMDPANRAAVDGAFKTSHLRNIELTGPYFHNGGFKTLLEVVELYDRGGNFCRFNFPDLDPDIQFLGLRGPEEEGLVRFMIALTDERVRYKQGPFDHPELRIPNGHSVFPDPLIAGQAQDDPLLLPAVGVGGVAEANKLKAFHADPSIGLPDGFTGHMVAGNVDSDVLDPTGAPKCNRPNP